MKTSGLVTIDVGGTFIKACLVSNNKVIDETIAVYDSKAKCPMQTILNQFMSIIYDQVKKAKSLDLSLIGIGFSFPGPFDYDQGICLIKGLDKYDDLYNLNLFEYFTKQIADNRNLREQLTTDYRILFKHDADSFALGESHFGHAKSFDRVICLTLGTGIGSSFIEHGQIVNDHLPLEGRIHLAPYQEGFAEDYISRRGILRIAESLGMNKIDLEVIDLAQLAFKGHPTAIQVFKRFGEILGLVLEPIVTSFRPNGIILGGQISKSSELFQPELKKRLSIHNIEVRISENSLHSTWLGIYHQFMNTTLVRGGEEL